MTAARRGRYDVTHAKHWEYSTRALCGRRVDAVRCVELRQFEGELARERCLTCVRAALAIRFARGGAR